VRELLLGKENGKLGAMFFDVLLSWKPEEDPISSVLSHLKEHGGELL